MFYRPRFLHYIYAFLYGYFWLPCPLCGKNFGGHEWGGSLMSSAFEGKGVCPKCGDNARKINAEKAIKGEWVAFIDERGYAHYLTKEEFERSKGGIK